MWCLFLVVVSSAIDCLERFVFEMTCYVSNGMLNPTDLLLDMMESQKQGKRKINNALI